MESEIVPYGAKYALVIEKSLPEQLGWEVGTKVDTSTDGESIRITLKGEKTGSNKEQSRLSGIVQKMDQQYGPVFRRLAE
jgi:hypothetical protein